MQKWEVTDIHANDCIKYLCVVLESTNKGVCTPHMPINKSAQVCSQTQQKLINKNKNK
jgi:hypothetical protein